MTLALGIDIGTSGIRTAVLDENDQVVSTARAGHLPQTADKIDATLWWEAVQTCIEAQTNALKTEGHDPGAIIHIAIDGTSGTMVATDEKLQPVSRALMYNSKGFDAEAGRIAAHAPDNHITLGSGSALGRAMRLVSEAEDGAARHILHQADFIAAKLTGLGGVSDHNNALKTGFDPETERWPDWVDNVIDPDVLPEARPVGAMLGPVLPQWIDHFGFSKHAQVHCGTTDSIAAFLAAAPLGVGHAVTSIGSTLAIKLLSPSRIDDPSIGLYSHKLGDHWLVGGASNAGGAVLSHYFEVDEIIALSAQMDPERPTGLNYYPLLEPGERFPVNDPELAPVLTPRPEKDVVFLQGVFEGLAAIETRCYGAMVERGAGFPAKIFTAGGASKNAVLTAIRQKALGVKLYEAIHTEAAVGVAKVWKLAQAAG